MLKIFKKRAEAVEETPVEIPVTLGACPHCLESHKATLNLTALVACAKSQPNKTHTTQLGLCTLTGQLFQFRVNLHPDIAAYLLP